MQGASRELTFADVIGELQRIADVAEACEHLELAEAGRRARAMLASLRDQFQVDLAATLGADGMALAADANVA